MKTSERRQNMRRRRFVIHSPSCTPRAAECGCTRETRGTVGCKEGTIEDGHCNRLLISWLCGGTESDLVFHRRFPLCHHSPTAVHNWHWLSGNRLGYHDRRRSRRRSEVSFVKMKINPRQAILLCQLLFTKKFGKKSVDKPPLSPWLFSRLHVSYTNEWLQQGYRNVQPVIGTYYFPEALYEVHHASRAVHRMKRVSYLECDRRWSSGRQQQSLRWSDLNTLGGWLRMIIIRQINGNVLVCLEAEGGNSLYLF